MCGSKLMRLIVHPMRLLIMVVMCTYLVLTSAHPVAAYTASKNNPSQDDEIMRKSQEILRSGPPSMKTVQERSNKGLNEVQGDAEKNQMKRPENSTGVTVEKQIEQAIEKVQPDK
jgi:hypothetical protein